MRIISPFVRAGVTLALGFAAVTAGAQTPGCTYDRCALRLAFGPGATGVLQGAEAKPVGFGTFVPRVDLLGTADGSVRQHYETSRKHYERYTALGFFSLAATLATFAYYSPKHEREWRPAPGVGLPLAALLLGWAGGASDAKGEDHLRRAIWLYNRALPRDSAATTIDCPYDRCALRLQPGMRSTYIVRGADAERVARLGKAAPHLADLFAAGGDSARAQYEAFQLSNRQSSVTRRVGLAAVVGSAVAFFTMKKGKTRDGVAGGLLVIAYIASHSSVYGDAETGSRLEHAIWFYNRALAANP